MEKSINTIFALKKRHTTSVLQSSRPKPIESEKNDMSQDQTTRDLLQIKDQNILISKFKTLHVMPYEFMPT